MIDEKITFKQINIAVITLSDTRKESDDKSGNTLKEPVSYTHLRAHETG